jgi:Family of unknown function (DUF6502)
MGIFPIYYSSMSRSVAQPSPALAASATSSISIGAAVGAIRQLLRPVIRLALKAGLKHAALDEIVRECLLSEAQALCDPSTRTNTSRLSVITGMHRKDIAARVAEASAAGKSEIDDRLAGQTIVSRVFSRWAHEVRKRPRAKTIPVANKGGRGKSFVSLAAEVVKDVHPRTILDELVRLGFVSETDGMVSLLTDQFSPRGSADDRLLLFTRNSEAMLDTGVENVVASRPPQLEYAIGTKDISLDDAKRIGEIAAAHWSAARDALYEAICSAPEVDAARERGYRVRVGTYVNYREQVFPDVDPTSPRPR